MSYPELPGNLLAIEEDILERWRDEDLFRQTLTANADGERFVFYEGPPTANGRPGLHHILSRTIKDLVCRHRAMLGHSVTRIAGWDTHGLPVEIEAEKKLGISGKPEIEALGIAEFNQACKDSVFTYKEEWEKLSERIGYWLEYWRPYVTFHTPYIESVWWILKTIAARSPTLTKQMGMMMVWVTFVITVLQKRTQAKRTRITMVPAMLVKGQGLIEMLMV